uniref:Uncharacterized protein n=1 Tax=Setaria viridis TaxID=4556 RepID=A0A4V6DCP0_SETVI|nr:hypothetical protein SEVIR_1G103650v2 [Setaria viridis]
MTKGRTVAIRWSSFCRGASTNLGSTTQRRGLLN